jgi:hypothetical protein
MMNEKNNYKWRQELNNEDEYNDDDNNLYAMQIKKRVLLNMFMLGLRVDFLILCWIRYSRWGEKQMLV